MSNASPQHPRPERPGVVLADILEHRALEHPEKAFALFDHATWTYRETAARAWAVGRGLQGLGVSPGDRVISWLPTGSDALEAWFGIDAAGGVYTSINLSYKGAMLERLLNMTEASVLIVHHGLTDRLQDLHLPYIKHLVLVGASAQPGLERFNVVSWDDLRREPSERPQLEARREPWDDLAVIFTSGTTSASKGVRCSYLHHDTVGRNLFPAELGPEDRYYLCLPMYHLAATAAIYTFLQRGGSIAVVESFSTTSFWDDVRRFGATCSNVATAMAVFLWKQEPRDDDADNPLRMAYMGPMLDQTAEFCERFGMEVFTTYGSTEVPCPIYSGPISDHTKSVGWHLGEGYEVRIVDENDQEVPNGTVGELIVRHDTPWTMFSGYLGMPEETAKVWRNGWFHTGDAMWRDDEGRYYFADRMRDTIRRRAENISSVEVESEILTHPDVLEAAVVAVPSEYQEDEVMAFVVPRQGHQIDLEDLSEHLAERLAYFMVPRYFEVVEGLPKTPTFKVQKADLRSRGVTASTWDRERSGKRLRKERFGS